MAQTAKIFKNGRSQAVRLPKEFRFDGDEVEIQRDPETGAVMLTPKEQQKKTVARKKPVQREVNAEHERHAQSGSAPSSPSVGGERKLSLPELYAIFDQADFPEDFFKREVQMPRELDLL